MNKKVATVAVAVMLSTDQSVAALQEENNTLRIDLWTKDMMVDEMKKFTCQNIITMADAFERSTGENEVAEEIRAFGKQIAIKMGVLRQHLLIR